MARTFVAGSSQSATHAAAAVTAAPLTMACWFKASDTAGGTSKTLMALDDGVTATSYFLLRALASTGACGALVPGGSATVGSGADGVWSHYGGVFASLNSRTAYKDGVAGTPETTSVTPTVTRTAIGVLWSLQYASGDIAEAAIWAAALDGAEMAALAKGISPLLIRPQSLAAYYPLMGNDSPELDRWKNRYNLTLNNAPVKAAHPRMFYPSSGVANTYTPAAAGGGTERMFLVF